MHHGACIQAAHEFQNKLPQLLKMARDSFCRLLEEAAQCNYSYAKKFVVWELKM